jgi:hypothetical protein
MNLPSRDRTPNKSAALVSNPGEQDTDERAAPVEASLSALSELADYVRKLAELPAPHSEASPEASETAGLQADESSEESAAMPSSSDEDEAQDVALSTQSSPENENREHDQEPEFSAPAEADTEEQRGNDTQEA